jgi:hypothetical protein
VTIGSQNTGTKRGGLGQLVPLMADFENVYNVEVGDNVEEETCLTILTVGYSLY